MQSKAFACISCLCIQKVNLCITGRWCFGFFHYFCWGLISYSLLRNYMKMYKLPRLLIFCILCKVLAHHLQSIIDHVKWCFVAVHFGRLLLKAGYTACCPRPSLFWIHHSEHQVCCLFLSILLYCGLNDFKSLHNSASKSI